jgi:hypothetical protein
MAPPSRGFRLLRDAVLSLSLTQDFVRPLYHWRTSRPHAYTRSALNCAHDDDARFTAGPGHGAPPQNVRLGAEDFLLDHIGAGFHLLVFTSTALPAGVQQVVQAARQRGVPLQVLAIGTAQPVAGADAHLPDADGRVRQRYACRPTAPPTCYAPTSMCAPAGWCWTPTACRPPWPPRVFRMNAPVDVSFFARAAKPITSYRPYWAKRFGTAPFLPMSRAEMEKLGWDSCDIIIVTGDAYVDHPSFGMAVIGRVLEAQGFRVGIIAQPDWHSAEAFKALGKPNLFWGVTAGNMDSMINRYTADRKIRSDDAYTPGDVGGKRPDRAAIVYSQRCREAYNDVPLILGGIEGSLRRIAHYDYWSDKVRRSIVVDAKCDLLLYGNAERALVEIAHRLAAKEPVQKITDVRGTAFVRRTDDESRHDWFEIDSSQVDEPGRVESHINPYQTTSEQAAQQGSTCEREDTSVSIADNDQKTLGSGQLEFKKCCPAADFRAQPGLVWQRQRQGAARVTAA